MAGWPLDRGAQSGVVSTFEDERGLGTLIGADGARFDFHCTAIADGTRSIDVGQPVLFLVRPGHRGRLEARSIEKR
jgi:cold shock CspA family protein